MINPKALSRATLRCVTIASLLASAVFSRGGVEISIDKEVQRQVDQSPTADSKIRYLCSIISTNEGMSDEAASKKASAITLLGKIGGTNVISILATNIDFIDKRSHTLPAGRALVEIGEPAVAGLLRALEDFSRKPVQRPAEAERPRTSSGSPARFYPHVDELTAMHLADAIYTIKGSAYRQFVAEQKGHVSEKVWLWLSEFTYGDGNK
jgi:hypothetical protein